MVKKIIINAEEIFSAAIVTIHFSKLDFNSIDVQLKHPLSLASFQWKSVTVAAGSFNSFLKNTQIHGQGANSYIVGM